MLGAFWVKDPQALARFSQSNYISRETIPCFQEPASTWHGPTFTNLLRLHPVSGCTARLRLGMPAPPCCSRSRLGLHGWDRQATRLHGLSEPSCPGGSWCCQPLLTNCSALTSPSPSAGPQTLSLTAGMSHGILPVSQDRAKREGLR